MTSRDCSRSHSTDRAAAKKLIERWGDDPTLFCREALGLELWSRQREVAESVVRAPMTACRSGQKVGKSTLAAGLAIWWALTRDRARTILTAPAEHQVRNILWPEVQRLYRESTWRLGPPPNLDPRTGWRLAGNRGIICVATKDVEKLGGLSGPNQLFVVDEGSGYDESLWPAIFGNLAGGGRILTLGNPTQSSGTFFDAFHGARTHWATHHIRSDEGPNFTGSTRIPGLATPDGIARIIAQFGEESPMVQVRVYGNFPPQVANAVIGLGLLEQARQRYPDTEATGRLDVGVDVARFGDDESVVSCRRGHLMLPLRAVHGFDILEVAGLVKDTIDEVRNKAPRVSIKVDETGLGAGVVDTLSHWNDEGRLGLGVQVVGVNVARASEEPDKYALLRDDLWFGLRSYLADGGTLPPNDERLEAELVAPIYSVNTRGQLRVERKEDIKKRIGRSPDRADAVCLAVYDASAEPIDLDWHAQQPAVSRLGEDVDRWSGSGGW